jgi:hypothetical protein
LKRTRWTELKRSLDIGYIAYRREIRKAILKLCLMLNMVLFIMALVDNMPSFVLYLINMHFLYKYMLDQYPESKIKIKDRYKDVK